MLNRTSRDLNYNWNSDHFGSWTAKPSLDLGLRQESWKKEVIPSHLTITLSCLSSVSPLRCKDDDSVSQHHLNAYLFTFPLPVSTSCKPSRIIVTTIFQPATMFNTSRIFRANVKCVADMLSHRRFSLGKLQTGIVGLPNVGKSTLFNALVGSEAAQAANFPFCTIGHQLLPLNFKLSIYPDS